MAGTKQPGHHLFLGSSHTFSDGFICQSTKAHGGSLAVTGMGNQKSWNLFKIFRMMEI
jgi:hypothetical protein